jgi:hypothetical protein
VTLTDQQSRSVRSDERWFLLVWLLVSLWLLACALLASGEYGDGYQTIANARFFFGDSLEIYVQRGPLAAIVLWPVEAVVKSLHLGPFDVRPYHFFSGILHSAYLLGTWLLLKRSGEAFVPRLIAYAVAILSVVFYANAPFLSHDIIPGFLFLLLIFLCDRWIREPTIGVAIAVVLLGTAVVLIKQTYAIFWVSICLYATLASVFRWHAGSVSYSRSLSLLGLAGLSGVLSWTGYGWFLGADIPSVALLERPLVLIGAVSNQYEVGRDISALFPWDLYLRNLHNYGIATVLLLIPGIAIAIRNSDARLRMIAVCWLVCAVVMQLTSFREVRYLAFLAPLSAMLIVPAVAIALKSRAWILPLVAVVVFDQYRGLTMAASQLSSTVRMDVARFVGEPASNGKLVSSEHLSFAFMAESPMRRDRYSGIFHLASDQLVRLNEGAVDVQRLDDPRDLGQMGIRLGDRVLYANRTVVRQPPWGINNSPHKLNELLMASGDAALIELRRSGDRFIIEGLDGRYAMFLPAAETGKSMPIIATGDVPAETIEAAYGAISGDTLSMVGVALDALCQADRCTYYE